MAELLPLISTIFIAFSAIFVAVGWYLVSKRKIEAHKKAMFWAAVLASIFFITYLSKTIFVGSTTFGGPEHVAFYYQIFLIIHIILATLAAILGIVTLVSGYKNNLAKHVRLGPITSVLWFISATTGIAVYLMLYVIFPPGETTNLFRAIIGG
ncbi:putative membrane protein [Evansella vedderi]|uniref:Membrane protein n=1 Tax=Evansella vedderi TaxID=38282 RepID=A0ABT9ZRI7_9BACI|nr:DUF420 domain-containing protein [Evansella vedderi]MDQ0253851.1 putative membrane protein [Evansella vedderi]